MVRGWGLKAEPWLHAAACAPLHGQEAECKAALKQQAAAQASLQALNSPELMTKLFWPEFAPRQDALQKEELLRQEHLLLLLFGS